MREDLDNILYKKGVESLLLYSNSYRDANMYYLTKFLVPDPFIFIKKIYEKPIIIVSQMEFLRAKKQSIVKDVRSFLDYKFFNETKSIKEPQIRALKFFVRIVKKELNQGTRICVPLNFPALMADLLRKENLTIEPMFNVVEKARETKDKEEIDIIMKIQRITEDVVTQAMELIANSEIGPNKKLIDKGKPLTIGKIKSFVGKKLIENGCLADEDFILACGRKSSDPHYIGESNDKLKADQPIIFDIYPRNIQKRYFTDMTRTIVKGKAPKKIKKMFNTILEAKTSSLDAIKAGAIGSNVYDICCDILEKNGYKTTRGRKKITTGMLHSLGHGVGLQVHETPRISEFSNFPFREHNVITVEPGLYDQKIGGVRLEDIIEITKNGYCNLTKKESVLEI